MMELNRKLLPEPEVAIEVLMSVSAALYTGLNSRKSTPEEREEIGALCAGMWQICDVLSEMLKGYQSFALEWE